VGGEKKYSRAAVTFSRNESCNTKLLFVTQVKLAEWRVLPVMPYISNNCARAPNSKNGYHVIESEGNAKPNTGYGILLTTFPGRLKKKNTKILKKYLIRLPSEHFVK
jgi:hypothetical protein